MKSPSASFIALVPLILFVGLFIFSALFFSFELSPLFTCLIAIIASLFTFKKNVSFNRRIELFLEGSAQPTVLAMCYIFIFSSIFTYILKVIGGTQAAVNLGLYFMPSAYILPGLFTLVSLFALAIGSSMGTIAAFLPIGFGIAQKLGIDPALIAGIVVSGAMLGDNLSIISDTTIAATQTTGCSMKDKFRANVRLVVPGFILTFFTLVYINHSLGIASTIGQTALPTVAQLITVMPYLLVFVCALMGIDVIAVLVIGILGAMGIGIFQSAFSFTQSTNLLLEGFASDSTGIQEVLFLSLLIAGLSHIVSHNGGIQYLLEKLSRNIHSKRHAEFAIAGLTMLVNAAIAINTIAILITGPVATQIGLKHGVERKRIALLLDLVACICQGILPYAPQLLLAASLSGTSSLRIIPYLHYQWYMLGIVIISILRSNKNA